MKELLVVVIPCMMLAVLADYRSVSTEGRFGEKVYIQKDRVLWAIMAVVLAVFVGLRTSYNDTYFYRHAYEMLATDWSLFSEIDWAIGSNPGFHFLNACLRISGVSTQSFLMVYALITVCIYLWFIRKYTDNIWMSMFLFFAMGCYTFTFAAIKQTVAVAFCLVATDKAINKKWVGFVLWVFIAAMFHPYSLMYPVVPFLMFNPWTTKTYVMLAVFGTAGVGLQSLLGTLIDVTSMMGEKYTVDSFSGDGVNVFRLAVMWVPVLLSYLARDFLKVHNDRARNLMINLMMLNAEIMFIALFGTANYFARLANYFLVFQSIALPMLFKYFERNSQKLLMVGAVAGYGMYSAYAEGVMYGGFDMLHNGISLLEYLRSLF